LLKKASKLLRKYREKRSFGKTPEPAGGQGPTQARVPVLPERDHHVGGSFVVQRHSATRLHYDFRLEVDGVLKSWAVPKGPPLADGEKRLAIQVEDHPLEYGKFEGVIPKGNYGAGDVRIWDRGTFSTEGTQSASAQIANGEIKFSLDGARLKGRFVLVKMRNSRRQNEWLFIRKAAGSAIAGAPSTPAVAAGRANGDTSRASKPRKRGSIVDPGTLSGAVRAAMPSKINVALATLADKPFSDDAWLFEIKWDGERAVVWTKDNGVTIRSRSHRDITAECPELRDFARKLSAREAIADGEIVALDEAGRSDFKKLQSRFGVQNPSPTLLAQVPIVYYAFDILYCDGYDLRGVPLIERKELLQKLLQTSPEIRYSDHQVGDGEKLFEVARKQELEGLIAKKMDNAYVEGRSRVWLKIKIVHDLDVVIGGWTAPRRSRDYFGALLMGLYKGSELRYIGSVGTGFDSESLAGIHARLKKLETSKSPFKHPPTVKEKITWVEPRLVARVKYAEWTTDLKLRQPVFLGFQNDRDASSATFAEQRKEPEPVARRPKGESSRLAQSGASKKEADVKKRSTKAAAAKFASRSTTTAFATRYATERPKSIESVSAIEAELSNGTAESLSVVLNGKEVALSHLNKIYFPEAGGKKRDLLLHYLRMSKYILPFLKDRPLVLKRYPNGIHGSFFFQKEAPQSRPEWMRTVSIYSKERGGEMEYFVADDLAGLLYLTNLGCIDENPWSSRVANLDRPDYVFFDFDPTEGTGFDAVVELAKSTMAQLTRLGMRSFLKTSGATGFHIYVPLEPKYSYEQVQMFAAAVAEMVKREHPDLVTFERSIKKRKKGSVLIDTVQNARGKPLAAAYSVRPVASVAVSAPVSAGELTSKLRADSWTIETIGARLKRVGDLWGDFWKHRQRLEVAVSKAK
jgi:bifunctional non-homologous end joining protein LigD